MVGGSEFLLPMGVPSGLDIVGDSEVLPNAVRLGVEMAGDSEFLLPMGVPSDEVPSGQTLSANAQ